MLVTLKEIMRIAEEKNIAVGAFNVTGLDALQGILDRFMKHLIFFPKWEN